MRLLHECEEIYYRQDNYVISVPEFPYFRIFLYRQKVRSYQRHFYNRRNWRELGFPLGETETKLLSDLLKSEDIEDLTTDDEHTVSTRKKM